MATHVIFDLDGTLLDTERVVDEVLQEIVTSYGKEWSSKNLEKRLGKRPIEAATAVVEDYELPCTPAAFLKELTGKALLRWSESQALPGADRLLKHLAANKVPVALASNSPRQNVSAKLKSRPDWNFSVIVAGDEVTEGKPSPQVFLRAAELLGAEPGSCLVIEDSPTGVLAGKSAGMEVVAVPSLRSKSARPQYAPADHVLGSLLDLKPELWGLPAFTDWIGNTLPIDPWGIAGPVVKGFGRGSKLLGIPTANLDTGSFLKEVAQQLCGIYLGWASLSGGSPIKMVMSVGWNPYFDNTEKTAEAWLLQDFAKDFYGQELRLIVVGYIRPEADFSSLEELIKQIQEDGTVAKAALDMPAYSKYQNDSFLQIQHR